MNDYSDLIILMGAIVLFMMLSLQVNRFIINGQVQTSSYDVEYHALNIAQQTIDDIRVINGPIQLQSYLNTFPRTIDFNEQVGGGDVLPFTVSIAQEALSTVNSAFENGSSSINSTHFTVTVTNDFFEENKNSDAVVLTVAKSFIN